MQRLTLCPHCDAIPASDQARFCGKCGKPLNPQGNAQTKTQQTALTHAAASSPSAGYWAGAAPVVATPSLSGASVASSAVGTTPHTSASPGTSPTQSVAPQPS